MNSLLFYILLRSLYCAEQSIPSSEEIIGIAEANKNPAEPEVQGKFPNLRIKVEIAKNAIMKFKEQNPELDEMITELLDNLAANFPSTMETEEVQDDDDQAILANFVNLIETIRNQGFLPDLSFEETLSDIEYTLENNLKPILVDIISKINITDKQGTINFKKEPIDIEMVLTKLFNFEPRLSANILIIKNLIIGAPVSVLKETNAIDSSSD